MKKARLTLVAATIVAFGSLSACGDDDGGGAEDFIADADEICKTEVQEINRLFAELGNPTGPEELAILLEDRIPISEQAISDLRELEPPEESSDDFESFLSDFEERNELLREQQRAASQADQPAVERTDAEIRDVDRRSVQLAEKIGFEACANKLPEEEQDEVEAVLNDITTTGDPAHCTEDYTENLVESAGSLEDCRRAESDQAAQADSVEIGPIGGVSETSANAEVTFRGGANDGKTLTHFLVFEDGRWKLDGVVEVPPRG
jgi:hypothetical protein